MTLRDEFENEVHKAINEYSELGYVPTKLQAMIKASHPVEVAKNLVLSGEFQDGFKKIIQLNRRDLTIECIMLRDEFEILFSIQELEAAQWRLDSYISSDHE